MNVSVVIPSYKRIGYLNECLQAIEKQTQYPYEIIIVLRENDEESKNSIRILKGLRIVYVSKPGMIIALNRGLLEVKGDIVAFTDDDSEPFPDWIEKITKAFEENEKIGGYGGRDIAIVNGVELKGKVKKIGKIQWFGRQIDSHHLELDPPRQIEVDVLKGVNMAYRRKLITGFLFDEKMNNKTTYMSELLICFWVKKRGGKLIYDPNLKVLHKIAPWKIGVSRDDSYFSYEYAHNYTYVLLKNFSWPKRIASLLYIFLIGQRSLPGVALFCIDFISGRKSAYSKFMTAQEGKVAGIKTWWNSL